MSVIHEDHIRHLGLLTASSKLLIQAAVATDTGEEETRCDRAIQFAEEALVHLKAASLAREVMTKGGSLHQAIQAHDEETVDVPF